MTKTEFKSIRGEKDFLLRYFNKEANTNLDIQTFSNLLSIWIMTIGIHPQQGIELILNYLDKKFA